MAGMAEVAKATVTIIPNMQGAQQTIASQLGDICGSAGDSASGISGSKFLNGFAGKLGALKGVMAKVLPTASVAAVGKALFSIGSEFDEMTDSIIVGTGASGQALEDLKQSAMDMATTVPMSFADAGNQVTTAELAELIDHVDSFLTQLRLDVVSYLDSGDYKASETV